MAFKKMTKATFTKALVIRINLFFLAFFLLLYVILQLCPSSADYNDHLTSASRVRCSLQKCHHEMDNRIKMKSMLEENDEASQLKPPREMITRERPRFLSEIRNGMKVGMVNMDDENVSEWKTQGEMVPIRFQRVSKNFEWKDLFPEWIDEEEEIDGPWCPEIPMPEFEKHGHMDMILAKLPCNVSDQRDVFRLQVHLLTANLAVKRGTWDKNGKMDVVFLSECRPMIELFRCDDLVRREGKWWHYRVEMERLQQKVALPVGSCNLALPLWGKGIDQAFDVSQIKGSKNTPKREAYASLLHSSETYVCGAITLAQTLLQTRTDRDLILLLDSSISEPKRDALSRAGWQLRIIKRIRNPHAKKNSYNEYNYSKFRLWLLTEYDKIVFIDSDIIVLRNLDVLFNFPQMSATGNDGSIFNSGIMVIEPSNCTFRLLMARRKEIISYNGGDQGFLNEVFVWWHRFPRRVNFLKNFWSNSTTEASVKNQLFGSDPPMLYSIHYLGLKPWLCYRDYDCNWDIPDQRVYASDVAHARWWRVYDTMDDGLRCVCVLSEQRKIHLEWDRKKAIESGTKDEHWRINITDPRKFI
ncbi:UDP-glucuronate:xylan alpha-glucuronosyltransferase 2 isoform X1 [Primulina tabacum]|uniref:UDP-glucuronate:xylan alpha-glucuronosyltransferase 2 isoform X1 n=2 Tax=Primulina tabacum TaxID=48773 RepID=UPI003F5A7BBC